jgi:hypothetical protein
MIVTDLFPAQRPKLRKRDLQRQWKLWRRNAMRQLRRQKRRLISQANQFIRSQYFLTDGWHDVRHAAVQNQDRVISSLLLAIILGYALITTSAQFLYAFFVTAYEFADASGLNLAILMLIAMAVIGILAAWVVALLSNAVSLSIMDGTTKKPAKSVMQNVRIALQRSSRVAAAWMLLCLVIVGPVFLGGLLGYTWIQQSGITSDQLLIDMPWMIIIAIAWILLTTLNFALVPLVALFEPSLSLLASFRRSHQLVRRRGRMFILGGLGLMLGLIIAITSGSAWLEQSLRISKVFPLSFSIAILLAAFQCLLVILYRKRKLARQ